MATTLSTNQTGFRPASSLKIFFRKSLNLIGYEKKISGTTRIVFLFKAFVIKLPRIQFRRGIKGFLAYHQEGLKTVYKLGYKKYRAIEKRRREIYREYLEQIKGIPKYQIDNTYQKFLFDGIMSNYHEFVFSLSGEENSFATPTYFSFFGSLNIQKRGKEFRMGYDEFRFRLERILKTAGILDTCEYWNDSHTMNNPRNFCQNEQGKLCILDYGNIRLHNFLKEYGRLIQDNFIFPNRRIRLHQILLKKKIKRKH